jgi:TP901 family phage tail tape measure protein
MFTATDMASSVMDRVKGNLKSLEDAGGKVADGLDSRMAKFGSGVAAMGIGAAGLMAGFGLARKAGDFEQAIAAVGAVSNASADDLKLLEKAAIDAGIATQFSPTQATLGLNELAQAGYDAHESVALLKPVLDLAAGSLGQLSPQEAAGVAAQAMKAFGIESKYAGAAVDQMLQASNMFAMRADDLPLALGVASRGAQALNQSLTETIITVGLVKNTVPGTERAATAVATAMERMVDPKVQKALEEQGVAVVQLDGNFRPFLDILGDMIPKLDKMSVAQKDAWLQATFGKEALGGLSSILAQVGSGIKTTDGRVLKGAAGLQYLRESFAGANGVAADFSKKMLDTLPGQMTLLGGSLETLSISIGKPFIKVFRPAVELAILAINNFLAVVNAMPDWLKVGLAAVTMFSFAFLFVAGAIVATQAIFPILIDGVVAAAGAFASLAVAAWSAIAPLLPFIAAAAALGYLAYELYTNWDELGRAFSYVGEVIASKVSPGFGKFKAVVLGAWQSIKSTAVELGSWLGDAFTTYVEWITLPFRLWWKAVSTIFGFVMRLGAGVGKYLAAVWKFYVAEITGTDLWKNMIAGFERVGEIVSTVWKSIKAGWAIVGDHIAEKWNAVVGYWKAGVAVISGAWSTLVGDWRLGADVVAEVFNRVVDTVASMIAYVTDLIAVGAAIMAQPFVDAWNAVAEVMQKVGGWVFEIVDKIATRIGEIVNWISELVSKVTGFFATLPDWFSSGATSVTALTTNGPGRFEQVADTSRTPGSQALPAASAVESTVAAAAGSGQRSAPAAIDVNGLAAAFEQRPIHAVFEVDGERMASVVARTNRSSAARGSVPVGAE